LDRERPPQGFLSLNPLFFACTFTPIDGRFEGECGT
jgi:hypothetical protein